MDYLVVNHQMVFYQKAIKIELIKEGKLLDLKIQMRKLKWHV